MSIFNKEEPGDYYPEPTPEKPSTKPSGWKIMISTAGALFAISHLGLLDYLIDRKPEVPQVPTINIPRGGEYSSYTLEAGPEGYKIQYRANDPKVLTTKKRLDSTGFEKGLFGKTNSHDRQEVVVEEYTSEGVRNLGGAASVGKDAAKTEECIRADAGARSQGAMAGSAIAAGVAVPAVSSIPYIGWLAGGWAMLLGQSAGSELGSEIGSAFNDC